MKKGFEQYLVQIRCKDGYTYSETMPWTSIIDKANMQKSSGEEIKVYKVSEFGKVTELKPEYVNATPLGYYLFRNSETGETEFCGWSREH